MSGTFSSSDRRNLLVVVSIYLAATALYAALGVRFDGSRFPGYMQFIDAPLLTSRLVESIWYYHANPPLMNLFLGIGLKLFGGHAMAFFNLSMHVCGLGFALCIHWLTSRLSASRTAADICTALVVFSPAFTLYENWLMYEFPAAALLAAAAVALYCFVDTRRTPWGHVFFGLLAVLLLTRSFFHLGWMVLIAVLLAVALSGRRRQVLTVAALPLLIVVGWYGKNAVLFGNFAASSWMGLGLSNISTLLVTRKELQPMVDSGALSRYALISRYEDMDGLFASANPPNTGIPVLDQLIKSTGQHNFNNLRIVEIDRYYKADAIAVARRFPASYVLGLYVSNRLFFSPPSMNVYFRDYNRLAVRPMELLLYPVLYGTGAFTGLIEQPHYGLGGKYTLEVNTSAPLMVVWVLVLGWGYLQTRRALVGPARDPNGRALVIGFIVLTTAYVYVIGTTLELGENYRYRFLVEPLFMTLIVAAAAGLIARIRARPDAASA